MGRQSVLDQIIEAFPDEEFLVADGFDDAVIGVEEATMRLVYSVSWCITILEDRDQMTEEDATEYFNFNVSGAYVGEKTPVWCYDDFWRNSRRPPLTKKAP